MQKKCQEIESSPAALSQALATRFLGECKRGIAQEGHTRTHVTTIRAASRNVIIDIDKPCHPCNPKISVLFSI